jgi:DNA-binding NarL/FixJ family response regulator
MIELTPRQSQVVERVAHGLPDKRIAAELRISVRTVHRHVQDAAAHLPGGSSPRHRLTLFFFNVADDPSG